jgi:hypothetical protein
MALEGIDQQISAIEKYNEKNENNGLDLAEIHQTGSGACRGTVRVQVAPTC